MIETIICTLVIVLLPVLMYSMCAISGQCSELERKHLGGA
jgi:hypothetical protein